MDRERRVARVLYKMVAADTVLLILFVLVVGTIPADLEIALGIFLPPVLIANYLYLRHRLGQIGPPEPGQRVTDWKQRFWLYLGSAIFFAGALFGLLKILIEGLPKSILPGLLIPFLFGLYCLKMARKAGRDR